MDSLGTQLDAHTVQFVRILPGPIARIWDYLWDGKKRGEWFHAGPMPAKPGEPFDTYCKHASLSPHQAPPPPRMAEMDQTGHRMRMVLLAAEPPRRLVIQLGPEAHESSDVEFLLSQEGDPRDDNVRLTLVHRKIPNRAYAVEVASGWHTYLAVLKHKAQGQVPPAFWDLWRQTAGTYEERYT